MKSSCYIRVTVFFEQEKDGRWTAECKELGTATFGNTFEETQEYIEETIELHLNTLQKNGQIEKFFKKNGIRLIKHIQKEETAQVKVPFDRNIFVNTFPVLVPAGAC
jgi:predicted RNase H-like HicB family nuclease